MIEPVTPTRSRPSSLAKVSKALIIPLIVGLFGVWTDYRLKREKLRADAGYETVAPVLKEMQVQVATLAGQVQVLQQLVLVMSQRPPPATLVAPAVPAGSLGTNVALDNFKNKLVMKVQKSQGAMALQQQLPAHLDDVFQTKK